MNKFLFGFIILIVFVFGCDGSQKNSTADQTEIPPRQQMSAFTTQHAESGVLKWKLIGQSAEYRSNVTLVQTPKIEIFENGELSMIINGDRGEILLPSQNMKIFGSVVAESRGGKLFTNELHWLNYENKIYAPNKSKIIRGSSVMFGSSAKGDPNLETVQMTDVRATLYGKDREIEK